MYTSPVKRLVKLQVVDLLLFNAHKPAWNWNPITVVLRHGWICALSK